MSEKLRGEKSTRIERSEIRVGCGVWGVCVGVCGGYGRVCGVCVGGVLGRVGVCVGACWGVRAFGERKYRSPLYYPDTLVHPDTCLGKLFIRYITRYAPFFHVKETSFLS